MASYVREEADRQAVRIGVLHRRAAEEGTLRAEGQTIQGEDVRCCSDCDQGRRRCPTPEACGVPEDYDSLRTFTGVLHMAAWCMLIYGIGLLLYAWLS